MFKHEDTDPRDCRYKIQNNKLRKQIDQILRDSRKKNQYFKSNADDRSINNNSAATTNVRNRKQKSNNNNNLDDAGDLNILPDVNFSTNNVKADKIKDYLDEIENILTSDEHDTFSHSDLTRMHQLLQYLESDLRSQDDLGDKDDKDLPAKTFKNKAIFMERFFFEFLENFKPLENEATGNEEYHARIRKLKVQHADREYSQMSSSVSRMIGNKGNKAGRFSLQEDIRSIRTTLLATMNAMMVIVAVFFFFYVAIGYSMPEVNVANKVLYSFAAAMISAIAEVYFLIRIV